MKTKPLVSVVMSCYDENLRFLELSIESILNQSYKNFELIIVNDKTNISNEQFLIEIEKKDSRIRLIKNLKRLGLAQNLNKAISVSNGSYILRMDTDDLALKNRIKEQVEFMQKNPEVDVAGSNAYYINESGNFIKKVKLTRKSNIYLNTMVIHPSVIGKKFFFTKNKYNPKLLKCQDFELWIRTYKENNITNIDKFLIKYRVKNRTFTQRFETFKYTSRIIFKHALVNNNILSGIYALVFRSISFIVNK